MMATLLRIAALRCSILLVHRTIGRQFDVVRWNARSTVPMPVFIEAIAGDAGGTIAFSIAKRGIPNA
jgi:hypothetical protein